MAANFGIPAPLAPWSSRDEEKLRTLTAQVEELQMRRVGAVRRLESAVVAAGVHVSAAPGLIRHAGDIRDALAPFDNGERPARSASDA